jgi:hypothetical protein
MTSPQPLFIGWSADPPRRRRLLGAGLALACGGEVGSGFVLPGGRVAIGTGVWDMGQVRTLRGVLSASPYPSLRTPDLGGGARTVFLATDGKAAAPLRPESLDHWVAVSGTLITRDRHSMLAVEGVELVMRRCSSTPTVARTSSTCCRSCEPAKGRRASLPKRWRASAGSTRWPMRSAPSRGLPSPTVRPKTGR